MKEIERDTLKNKLECGDPIRLVMALSQEAYCISHIAKSSCYDTPEACMQQLKPEEEIVVYCTGSPCRVSEYLCKLLEQHGFKYVYHYKGGLMDWYEAHYPLEGNLIS